MTPAVVVPVGNGALDHVCAEVKATGAQTLASLYPTAVCAVAQAWATPDGVFVCAPMLPFGTVFVRYGIGKITTIDGALAWYCVLLPVRIWMAGAGRDRVCSASMSRLAVECDIPPDVWNRMWQEYDTAAPSCSV